HGLGARDRALDRPRGRRRGRARGGRGRGRPARGAVRGRRRAGRRARVRVGPATDSCTLARDERRGGEMAASVKEFFDTLPGRVGSGKAAGVNTTYLFDIEGAGQWTVAVSDD